MIRAFMGLPPLIGLQLALAACIESGLPSGGYVTGTPAAPGTIDTTGNDTINMSTNDRAINSASRATSTTSMWLDTDNLRLANREVTGDGGSGGGLGLDVNDADIPQAFVLDAMHAPVAGRHVST